MVASLNQQLLQFSQYNIANKSLDATENGAMMVLGSKKRKT
jgi:hypothetical protein